MDPSALKRCVLGWYDTKRPLHEREEAARVSIDTLLPHLRLPPSLRAIATLKEEELLQDTWRELFDPEAQRLASVEPEQLIPHVRSVLRNRALRVLRRTLAHHGAAHADNPAGRSVELVEPGAGLFEEDGTGLSEEDGTGLSEDAALMAWHLGALAFEERMAVLLTTCPDRISEEDWLRLVPAGGRRPVEPLDMAEASRLLLSPEVQFRELRHRALARLLEWADGEED